MTAPVQVIGSFVSPYVRKVLVCLELKGLQYEVDPIVPFFGNEEFARLSPLRRIPVLRDERVTLCDSSVICQYLEDRYPSPGLYPKDLGERARARWIEEYADTRMGDVLIWRLFNQLTIKPHVWGEPTDQAVVDHALQVEIPGIVDYLESQLGDRDYFCGGLSIADIAAASLFRNAHFARWRIDAARWPRAARWLERCWALPAFQSLARWEDLQRKTPVAQHRAALLAAGAPLLAVSYGGERPQRGLMGV
ncbi:MAG TPA: glutathione S-transferase family protein [Solimonas sp.]|nr:glutathione S-transferase family protein [Solimonas sp.]